MIHKKKEVVFDSKNEQISEKKTTNVFANKNENSYATVLDRSCMKWKRSFCANQEKIDKGGYQLQVHQKQKTNAILWLSERNLM